MTIDKIDSHEVTSTIEVKAAGTGDLSVQDKGICYSQGVVTPTVSDENRCILVRERMISLLSR